MAAGTMPVGGRQHVFEKLASILGLVAAPLMLLGLSACGRSAGKTSEPTCPTEPIDAADSSTTPDPSCVVRATEINGNGSRIHAETTAEYLLGVVNWVTKWNLDCVEGCK